MASMGRDAPTLIAFGGAFDPPHRGHQDMVRLALAALPAARVVVLPAAQPAAAQGSEPKFAHSSFTDRLRLCELAFAGLGQRVQVAPTEAELPVPNRTLNTLQRLHAQFSSDRLGFLLGQDQLAAFPRWHAPTAILGLADLIVAPRSQTKLDSPIADLRSSVATCAATLGLGLNWITEHAGQLQGAVTAGVRLLDGSVAPAASRTIRAQLAGKQDLAQGWLAAEVRAYIDTHHLYTSAAAT